MRDWFEDWARSGDGSTMDEFMRRETPRAKPTIDTGLATVFLDGQFWYDESIVSGCRQKIHCPEGAHHTIKITAVITTPFGVYDLLGGWDAVAHAGQIITIDWPNPLCTMTLTTRT